MPMINEERVRQYISDLDFCLKMPCTCAEEGHSWECQHGGMMMLTVRDALCWVLGEKEEVQPLIDRLHDEAERMRTLFGECVDDPTEERNS